MERLINQYGVAIYHVLNGNDAPHWGTVAKRVAEEFKNKFGEEIYSYYLGTREDTKC